MSFDALEDYYQSQAREWERYAMIKARVVAGEPADRAALAAMLRPFVYRRYLDFGAIESLREMKQMIAKELHRKGMDANIKLGPGGIREIEFIGQALPAGARRARSGSSRSAPSARCWRLCGQRGLLPADGRPATRRGLLSSCAWWRTASRPRRTSRPTCCRATTWAGCAWRAPWASPTGRPLRRVLDGHRRARPGAVRSGLCRPPGRAARSQDPDLAGPLARDAWRRPSGTWSCWAGRASPTPRRPAAAGRLPRGRPPARA